MIHNTTEPGAPVVTPAPSEVFEGQILEAFSCEIPEEGLQSFTATPLNPEVLGKSGKHRVYNFEVAEHHTYIADGIRVHNNSVHYTVEIDGVPHDVVAPEGSPPPRDDGTIIGPDGRVIVWVDANGNAGYTSDPLADGYEDNIPNYSEALLDNYGIVENGVARTTFLGTARAIADGLGFDGSFGIDGSFRADDEGNSQGGNGPNDDTGTPSTNNRDRDNDGTPDWKDEDYSNIGHYNGDRDNDGTPNYKDFDDGVGWLDQNKPIVLDLDGDGIEVLGIGSVLYDIDGDSYLEETSWVGPDDGFLIVDLNNNGEVDQHAELVLAELSKQYGDVGFSGNHATYLGNLNNPLNHTDLQALAHFGDDQASGAGHGVINSDDDIWKFLKVWNDENQNGEQDEGELKVLADYGITEIGLEYDDGTGFDDTNNDVTVFDNTLYGSASYKHDGTELAFGDLQNGEYVVEGGVGDIGLAYTTLGYEYTETAEGYTIRVEDALDAGTGRYLELPKSSSPDKTITSSSYNGVYGDSRDNVISISSTMQDMIFDGGDGKDHIDAAGGNDVAYGGNSDDTLFGKAGSDQLFGGSGRDTIDGGSDNDVLFGGDGTDSLKGASQSDMLYGEGGNDYLYGGSGNDTLSGGDGNDRLAGWDDDDTYLVSSGDDTIRDETGGNDRIVFEDLVLAAVSASEVGNDLVFSWDDGTLAVEDHGVGIERFEFTDGISFATFGPSSILVDHHSHGRDRYVGTSGDDYIVGGAESSVVVGGAGNDILEAGGYSGSWNHLQGQSGDDTYLIGKDDGKVMIVASEEDATDGVDQIVFRDLSVNDLTFNNDIAYNRLVINWNKDGYVGELRIGDYGTNIEKFNFEFVDGSSFGKIVVDQHTQGRDGIYGTDGDDHIIGGGQSNVVVGGAGNDTLEVGLSSGLWSHLQGGIGDDTYIIDKSDGKVMIVGGAELADGGHDTIVFSDLSLDDVTASIHSSYDRLVLTWNSDGRQGELQIDYQGSNIERYEFNDGASISADEFSFI